MYYVSSVQSDGESTAVQNRHPTGGWPPFGKSDFSFWEVPQDRQVTQFDVNLIGCGARRLKIPKKILINLMRFG